MQRIFILIVIKRWRAVKHYAMFQFVIHLFSNTQTRQIHGTAEVILGQQTQQIVFEKERNTS